MTFRYTLETTATPDQVFRALTDFSDRRLEIWEGTLSAKLYELRERGDTWAVAKEGTGLNIWVVLRYDWEAPDTIRWSMVDSSHCDRGAGLVTIEPKGAGSVVHVEIDHSGGRGLRGKAILRMQSLIGPTMFPRFWKKALDRFALTDRGL